MKRPTTKKSVFVQFQAKEEERQAIRDKAKKAGLSMSEFLRRLALNYPEVETKSS